MAMIKIVIVEKYFPLYYPTYDRSNILSLVAIFEELSL